MTGHTSLMLHTNFSCSGNPAMWYHFQVASPGMYFCIESLATYGVLNHLLQAPQFDMLVITAFLLLARTYNISA